MLLLLLPAPVSRGVSMTTVRRGRALMSRGDLAPLLLVREEAGKVMCAEEVMEVEGAWNAATDDVRAVKVVRRRTAVGRERAVLEEEGKEEKEREEEEEEAEKTPMMRYYRLSHSDVTPRLRCRGRCVSDRIYEKGPE